MALQEPKGLGEGLPALRGTVRTQQCQSCQCLSSWGPSKKTDPHQEEKRVNRTPTEEHPSSRSCQLSLTAGQLLFLGSLGQEAELRDTPRPGIQKPCNEDRESRLKMCSGRQTTEPPIGSPQHS